jgi:Mn2+/Fe2+ NRAMP family transporter
MPSTPHDESIAPLNPIPSAGSGVQEAPRTFRARLGYLGPGLILTASVVGSGEVIATTGLGAKAGFVALWLVLVSCVIKVGLQWVLSCHAIYSGQTTLHFLDTLPGPRYRAGWFIWMWLPMLLMVNLQQGAMLGGVAMALHMAFPQISVTAWAIVTALLTILLLRSGRYRLLEKGSTIMVAAFTLATFICVGWLQRTSYSFSSADLWSGLEFHLPQGGAAIALAAFGITGVGATELILYPYWCLKKGYGRAVGAFDGSEAWHARAHGWLKTMKLDVLLAMVIYTVLTLAFFILGASVLHREQSVPEGMQMVVKLSRMFTEVLGPGAFYVFLLGVLFALYSTLFVSVAANAELYTDCFELLRWTRIRDEADRLRWIQLLVTLQPLLQLLLFLWLKLPLWMVILGGTAQALMLPVIAFSTLYVRYKRLTPRLAPSRPLDMFLWFSALCIVVVGAYTLWVSWLG